MLPYLSDPLVFPVGVAAGFNPSHIAATNTVLSGIPVAGNHINIITGLPGVVSGSVTPANHAVLGSVPNYGFGSWSQHANMNIANQNVVTMGAIVVRKTAGSDVMCLSSSSSNNGTQMFFTGSSNLFAMNCWGATTATSAIVIPADIPFFVAFTKTSGEVYFISKNLLSGVTVTDRATGSYTATAGSGTAQIGSGPGTFFSFFGLIAGVMWSNTCIGPAALSKWAERPWDFWYPPEQMI